VAWSKAYLYTKWHLDPSSRLATINMDRKRGLLCSPVWGEESWIPITSVPSGTLIYLAVWPQQTWAENWGCAPFGAGELDPHFAQRGLGQAYLRTKWRLDPSSRLATTDMGQKLEVGWGCEPFWGRETAGSHIIQCRQGQGLPPYPFTLFTNDRPKSVKFILAELLP